jgi:fatty acid-binding protein 3, muscle and heart
MKEIGVGMMMRMAARGIKPRLIISEDNGKWTVRSESTIKNHVYEFTPGVEFDETTPDGRQVKVRDARMILARGKELGRHTVVLMF